MRRALVLIAGACACGGGSGGAPDADFASLTFAPCAPEARVGGFEVVLDDEFTGVQGQVADGVISATVLETVAEDGACRIARAPALACEPPCAAEQTCTPEGTCVAYPAAHDVGAVTVTGLAAPVTMEPRAPAYFYSNAAALPHPGFAAGADIELHTGGGDYAPFALRGWGVSAIVGPDQDVVVESGSALALSWTPPPETGPARIDLSLNINGHGVVGSRIECTVDDTGSFTIPEPLITTLVADGLSGFPTLQLTRSSADSATVEPGCVDFRVRSSLIIDVVIPGLISCNGNEDCPEPQTCQPDLTCG